MKRACIPMIPQTLFPFDDVKVVKRYRYRDHLEINEKFRFRVRSSDCIGVLRRLIHGDYKTFIDVYVENNVCSYVMSTCKEFGPRILISITDKGDHLELYSECIDVEILLELLLGDLHLFVEYEDGYRGSAPYKKAFVPVEILDLNIAEQLYIDTELRDEMRLSSIKNIDELVQILKNSREVIVAIQCLNEIPSILLNELLRLGMLGTKVYIVTQLPSEVYEICNEKLHRMILLYMDLLERASKNNVKICISNIAENTIIIDRKHVIVVDFTQEKTSKDFRRIIAVEDTTYAQNLALTYLRSCLCSLNLVRRIG